MTLQSTIAAAAAKERMDKVCSCCMWVVVLLFTSMLVEGNVQVDELFCPVCNMVTEPQFNQSFRGNQAIYSCLMGHEVKIAARPTEYLGNIERIGPSFPAPYTPEHMACPVCGMTSWDSGHAISIGPHGNQKLFACSREHAETIRANPKAYFINREHRGFCSGGSVMLDGFQSSIGGTCTVLLFPTWVLDSGGKYALGFCAILFLAMFLEFWGEFQQASHRTLMRLFGKQVYSRQSCRPGDDGQQELYVPIIVGEPTMQMLPMWCHCILAVLYMLHIALAYIIMLVVMSYETGMFFAIVLGLGLGFLVFKDTEGETMSRNVDPCCST